MLECRIFGILVRALIQLVASFGVCRSTFGKRKNAFLHQNSDFRAPSAELETIVKKMIEFPLASWKPWFCTDSV